MAAAAARHPSSSAVSEMRCRVLHLIPHGRYTCTRGFEVDSRCDFTCSPGYRFEGENSRTCLPGGSWSGVQPVCTGEYKESIQAKIFSACVFNAQQLCFFFFCNLYINVDAYYVSAAKLTRTLVDRIKSSHLQP